MTATLQERLNYLVNYSSQLIFVSGNSLADQTQALEATLFQQHENTELAYLVADDSFEVSDYRRLLCNQLVGRAPTLSRPLNECLASLNQHEGPVLIAITRAEKMPNEVLQELWELVLQSRFAGNKQHLNVILFGETQWAAKAKRWLPANNSGTPLLLSTQQTSFTPPGVTPEPNKRGAAEPHSQQQIEQRPIISMGAFWAATVLVFLSILVVITVWLYGEQASQLFSPISQEPASSVAIVPAAEQTIMQWPTPEQVTQALMPPEGEKAVDVTADESIISSTVTSNEAPVSKSTENPLDAPVGSTVDDPLGEPSGATPTVVSNPASTKNTMQKQAEPLTELPVSPEIAADGFYIQIAGLKDASLLSRFLRDNGLSNNTITYQTQRYGGPWHVVLMKTHYDTVEQAKAGISQLPEFQNKSQAFVKKAQAIRKELSEQPAQDKLVQ